MEVANFPGAVPVVQIHQGGEDSVANMLGAVLHPVVIEAAALVMIEMIHRHLRIQVTDLGRHSISPSHQGETLGLLIINNECSERKIVAQAIMIHAIHNTSTTIPTNEETVTMTIIMIKVNRHWE